MRITASVAGILLIAAAAVALDDSTDAAAVSPDDVAITSQIRAAKKHVSVGTVSIKETKNAKTGVKSKVITITSEQDKDSPFVGTMRLTAEIRDGTNIWYGQKLQVQKKKFRTAGKVVTSEIDYSGEDVWNFSVPFGKDKNVVRPDINAYAAEYGFVVSNKVAGGKAASNNFVVVAAKYKDVDSADEIMARNQGSKNVLKNGLTGRAFKQGEGASGDGGGGE
ncbi:MAG: hypothetical protein HOO88_07610 [Kiritimatiellaceae bacterium]|nr:hypothetical protein [Kiritimatiellaceae bacterium]